MPPRRLVRQQPLIERLKTYFNLLDALLWVSETLDSRDWDQWQKDWATTTGIGINLLMLLARANSGTSRQDYTDDVFSDTRDHGLLSWFAIFVVYFLSCVSIVNTVCAFYRKRHYRLFEASIDAPQSTPSAHRVRVDSSPISSSPLRFLSNLFEAESAEARAHPDATRDVWEISVWNPSPLCLSMFCWFSPGHVLVYWLFLPTLSQDTRPSTTVLTTIILVTLLSVQLTALRNNFSQQSKDSSLIQKEVMNEYDAKYVHPLANPLVRDVGTQFSSRDILNSDLAQHHGDTDIVQVYAPVIVVNRGFRTKPNSNYTAYFDPDGLRKRASTPTKNLSNGLIPSFQTPAHLRDASSPIQPRTAARQSQYQGGGNHGGGDGGNLGVYTHANSPLKKTASTHFGGGYLEQERSRSPTKGTESPMKRHSMKEDLASGIYNPKRSFLQGTATQRESSRF